MKEFMLLIHKQEKNLPAEKEPHFLKACEVYIEKLKKGGHLKSAQPMEHQGRIISGSKGAFKEGPFNKANDVIAGYYHLRAKDLDEAVALGKENPEFEYGTNVSIEVHPLKGEEKTTGYVYPK